MLAARQPIRVQTSEVSSELLADSSVGAGEKAFLSPPHRADVDRSSVIVSVAILLVIALTLATSVVDVASGSRGATPMETGGESPIHPVMGWSPTVGAVANNTTQHEDPERIDSGEDVSDVIRWLEGRLAGRLGQSTVELNQGQADAARRLLGEEFTDQFERYAYVTSQTRTNDDDRTSEQFRETRQKQEEFTTAVQEYRETRDEYEEARRNGNETGARRLARELQRLSRTANRTGGTLRTDYGNLSNGTAADLSEASGAVQNITDEIDQQQAEIVQETFVRTALTLRPDSRRISFLTPLSITGQLAGEDGSTPAERPVRLRIGNQTIRAKTNANGTFTATYRPTLLRAGEQPVTVRYLPRNESVYLGSNGSVTVSVVQVTPDLSVEQPPEPVVFGDQIEVAGTLSAQDIGARGVPVTVRLGGVRLGTVRTTADGTYSFSGHVPAGVDDGERALTVSVSLEDRALASVDRSEQLTVDPTETELTVSGEQITERTVRVRGTLQTADSNGIPDQQIELMVDGQSITTARTNSEGRFTERVSLPAGVVPDESNVSVRLAARYERPSSSLLASRARTTLRLRPFAGVTNGSGGVGAGVGSAGSGSLISIPEGIPIPLAAGTVVMGLFVLVGGAAYRRRGRAAREEEESTDEDPTDLRSIKPPVRSTERSSSVLTGANAALEDGDHDTAVKLAYTSLKRTTTERLELPDGTHWEFVVACRTVGLGEERLDVLARLTETYEQAAFAPRSVSVEDANWVVETVATFDPSANTDT